MTDLIIHIGLSKCGSSTLQRQVFQNAAGYLGTAPGIDRDSNYAKQLQACAALGGRQFMNHKELLNWSERVEAFADAQSPAVHRLILSDETLSGANWLDDRPVIRLLAMLKERVWTRGQVKVLLVLRNQAERLASSYAQTSSRRPEAGQQGFEDFVLGRLASRRHRRLLDYSSWIDSIHQVIGKSNSRVLLLEDSGRLSFW